MFLAFIMSDESAREKDILHGEDERVKIQEYEGENTVEKEGGSTGENEKRTKSGMKKEQKRSNLKDLCFIGYTLPMSRYTSLMIRFRISYLS